MHVDMDKEKFLSEEALLLTKESAEIISMIEESLILLSGKRRTLEEKAIIARFHFWAQTYACIIQNLHSRMSAHELLGDEIVASMHKLRTVNEKVRKSLQELLKILKYDFNFLEQYFEYDYCARLLADTESVDELERLVGLFVKP